MELNLPRMEFVHPEILWGLGALAIPIAIHLLHFRRFKRVQFSQVAFLRDVQRDTRATQQIRHWWVLLLRLLAFAALICAFAQPTWFEVGENNDASASGHAVSIYVDNSLSMEGMGEEGQLLQSARNKAALVIAQYEPTDQFQILTNDFSGRDQTFLTQEQALERVEEIRISTRTQPLTGVLERVQNQLTKALDRNRTSYVFTDLQASTHAMDADGAAPDSTIDWFFVPEWAGSAPNIWVDSVWFDTPVRIQGRDAAVHVRIDHNSRASVDGIPMHLSVNGDRVAIGTFNLVPGIPTDTVLRFTHSTAGIQSATVHVEDAPIRFDDDWHFGYDVMDRINILILSPSVDDAVNQALRRTYQTADGLYAVRTATQWSPGDLANEQVVILNGWEARGSGFNNALKAYAMNGGTVVLLPESTTDPSETLAAFGARGLARWRTGDDRVEALRTAHPFFADMFEATPDRIDLPSVNALWTGTSSPREEILIATETGRTFLSRIPSGRGQLFVFYGGAATEQTNLTRHALWVPLMLRIAERSAAHAIHQAELGQTEAWSIALEAAPNATWSLEGPIDWNNAPSTPQRWMPEVRELGQQLRVSLAGVPFPSGHYRLKEGESARATLGLNQDRTESDHIALTAEAFESTWDELGWPRMQILRGTSSTLPQVIQRMEQGVPLWKALLIIALAALAAETLLLRTWKSSSKA